MSYSQKTNFLTDVIAFLLSTPTAKYTFPGSGTSELIANEGFWGVVDSSVDWCEGNYEITPYIAEFFNTISAIPMITWSIVGWYLCYKSGVKEKRYLVLLCSLALIGLGSICFHGTLKFFAQLLDELPMMIASYCSLFCSLELKNKTPSKKLMFILFISMILQSISYVFYKWYLIFIGGYSLIMLIQIIIILKAVSNDFKMKKFTSQSFWLGIVGLLLILGSCSLWILENIYCEQLGRFKLHAVWHIFGGYGLFLLDLLLIYVRGSYLKKESTLNFSKAVGCHYVEYIDV